MKASTIKLPNGHGSLYKEVRFSPTATPMRRAQSAGASTPATNSKHGQGHDSELPSQVIFSALDASYLDQSRALLESQRANFERERALFAEERLLWEKERSMLRSKIAELESFFTSQGASTNTATLNSSRPSFETPQYGRTGNTINGSQFLSSAQVWEGTSPGTRPSRVFLDEEIPDQNHLSPITEGGGINAPSLDAALSPQGGPVDPSSASISVPVPIEKLDSQLDGITLKSTALPPGVVARVITPPSPSSLDTSPTTSSSAPAKPNMEHRNSLRLKLSDLGPPNENLIRDAGHTPMAIIEGDISLQPTQETSPIEQSSQCEEAPLAPVVTTQPVEGAESYFPEVPDDPALKGPLSLTNDVSNDNNFLDEVDQKLLGQAKRILSSSTGSADANETDTEIASKGEPEPELKFKNSTNFGTAFGLSSCGKI